MKYNKGGISRRDSGDAVCASALNDIRIYQGYMEGNRFVSLEKIGIQSIAMSRKNTAHLAFSHIQTVLVVWINAYVIE